MKITVNYSVYNNLRLLVFILFLLFLLFAVNLNAQIVFNEIMFDAEGADYHDEFIELVNLAAYDTVDLSGWRISDSLYDDYIIDAGNGLKLAPHQYAVILDGSYFANSTTYDDIIPDSALIVAISDNAFTKSGLSNSTSKSLFLYNASNKLIQKYRYSVGNIPGHSDEKIILNDDNSSSNWGNSIALKGTPGFYNSISPLAKDIGFGNNGIEYHPTTNIKTGQDISTILRIENFGSAVFRDSVQITLFLDRDADSLYNNDDIVVFQNREWFDIRSGEYKTVEIIWQAAVSGKFLLMGQITSTTDQRQANNSTGSEIVIVDSESSVKISEIKFLTAEKENEWIELFNEGERKISLKDWAIADDKDTVWVDSLIFIYPGQYKVFTGGAGIADLYGIEDSSICILQNFPTLNNNADVVYLINPAGGWEEQVPYTIDWLEGEEWRNPSLERISFSADSRYLSNWGPSTAKNNATPAKENSLYLPAENSTLTVEITPNPFSPDGDGFEDHCVISVKSPTAAARVEVKIFDILGREVRVLKESSFQGSSFEVIWNGRDNSGLSVRMGIYLVYIRLIDDKNGILEEMKESVVVAGKL